jgi:hypothetical protein
MGRSTHTYEKRRREIEKQQKQAAKREKREAKKNGEYEPLPEVYVPEEEMESGVEETAKERTPEA